ncbi:MAG: class I SAM-dependent methyltransferase [Candidatus Micrarchaeaceae archaeon]|jgi:O-methyltransferase involved in polyketide biosynthesis
MRATKPKVTHFTSLVRNDDALELSAKLSDLSKTALGVVYGRVTYGKMVKPEIKDPLGQKFLRALEYKPVYHDAEANAFMQIFAPLRTRVLDDIVAKFIKDNKGEVLVINLGCGLCTRYERLLASNKLDPKRTTWIDVDLPAMIELRESLWNAFSPGTMKLQIQIPSSIFQSSWVKKAKKYADKTTLIIAEGILGYYEPNEVKMFFEMMAHNFPEATILHNTIHTYHEKRERAPSYKRPRHKWFVDSGKEVEQISSGFHLVKEVPFLDKRLLNMEMVSAESLALLDKFPKNYSIAVMLKHD